MMIIGCDLHTRTEQIAMLDTETGEVVEKRLEHENGEAKRFYEGLKERALVGVETTGYALWFAEMLSELGHELVVGDAAKIRKMEVRKQKHDRRGCGTLAESVKARRFSEALAAQRGRARRAGAAGAPASVGRAAHAGQERTAGDGAQLRSAAALSVVERGGPEGTAKASFKRRDGAAAGGPAAAPGPTERVDQGS